MPTYTLTTDPSQEALLTWIVDGFNKEHDAAVTNAGYVQMRLPQLMAPYVEAYRASVAQQIVTAFTAADAATQSQVLGLLTKKVP